MLVSLFAMAPERSAEVLPHGPKLRKAVTRLTEKIRVLGELSLGRRYNAAVVSSM